MSVPPYAVTADPPLLARLLRTQRTGLGLILAVVAPVALEGVLGLLQVREFPVVILLHLLVAVAVAAVGGVFSALLATAVAFALLTVFSIDPVGSFAVGDPDSAVALVVFLVVSCSMAAALGVARLRASQAERARDESALLNSLALQVLGADDSLESFLNRLSGTLGGRPLALLEVTPQHQQDEPAVERLIVATSDQAPVRLGAAGAHVAVGDRYRILAGGEPLDRDQQHLLQAFVALAEALRSRRDLVRSKRENARLSRGNDMRTAILHAVSHDLRTPIAGIKLNVATLRQPDISFDPADQAELLLAVEDYADRLDTLVSNLLDLSRIQAEAMEPLNRNVGWDSVLPGALRGIDPAAVSIEPGPAQDLNADPGMLERAVANVVENAIRHGRGAPVRISSGTIRDGKVRWAELRVSDKGPGLDFDHQELLFQPFQSTQDTSRDGVRGVGLGLAVARGFMDAMGGTVHAEQTPGGGTTMVLRLPLNEPDRTHQNEQEKA